MQEAPIPVNEKERIRKLQQYEILDTLPEADFDDFTKLASTICQTPIALISLVDENRQWFKSKVGLAADQTPREMAFCSHSILQNDVFIVPNTALDQRFNDNPLVTNEPHIKFYAGAPLVAPTGEKLGTICVIDTQPRELTKEQSDCLDALSRQIINQLELRLINIKKQKALDSKSLFLSTMSHEIRTPLNGILGCANILNDMVNDSDEREMTKTIMDCGESLLGLINDVLDFSKMEAGNMQIECCAFNLRDTISNVAKLFESVAEEKDTKIEIYYPESAPDQINGDPVRMRQVVSNFLSNAIKFSPSGTVKISVNAENISDRDVSISISVSDDGIGISEDDQKKLFKPFSQVDASTTRKYGGTGLGLSICKALTELMSADIWFESELGQGSTFGFTLKTEAVTVTNRVEAPQRSDMFATRAPMNILIAEDNSVNQMVIDKLLKSMGYSPKVASNGREALERLAKESFDLVLMDRFMPEMDGLIATKEVRAQPDIYGTPRVIALTASAMQEDRQACLSAGMNDFITKPFNAPTIERVLLESFKYLKTAELAEANS